MIKKTGRLPTDFNRFLDILTDMFQRYFYVFIDSPGGFYRLCKGSCGYLNGSSKFSSRFCKYLNDTVRDQILQLYVELEIDEMALVTWVYDEDVRRKSFSLIADAFDLKGEP